MRHRTFTIRPSKRWATTGMVLLLAGILVPTALAAGGTFSDDDTSIFEADIEWLAEAGVTRGCNPPANDRFCPADSLTRGQMAAFIRRFAQFLGAEDGTVSEAHHAASAGDSARLGGLDAHRYRRYDGSLQVSASAFTPEPVNPAAVGLYVYSPVDVTSCANAPVDLPPDVTVTGMTAWVYDVSSSHRPYVNLSLVDWSDGGAEIVTYVGGSADGTPGFTEVESFVAEAPAAGAAASLLLTACSTGGERDVRIYGVEIAYDPASAQ